MNILDIYRKVKRVYANGRRKPTFKGEKKKKKKPQPTTTGEDGMPPPKIRRSSSRRSSFESVEEIEEGLREMDPHLKDEFDYKILKDL